MSGDTRLMTENLLAVFNERDVTLVENDRIAQLFAVVATEPCRWRLGHR